MNKSAASCIERCLRVCKFKIVRSTEIPCKNTRIIPALFDVRVLDMPIPRCILGPDPLPAAPPSNRSSMQAMQVHGNGPPSKPSRKRHVRDIHAADAHAVPSEKQNSNCCSSRLQASNLLISALCTGDGSTGGNERILPSFQQLHSNFSVHALPEIVRIHQHESLCNIHGACSAMLHASTRMSFCIVCAINGKGFQSKLRMCSVEKTVSCITCQPGKCFCTHHPGIY